MGLSLSVTISLTGKFTKSASLLGESPMNYYIGLGD